jgi:hypothetical protein
LASLARHVGAGPADPLREPGLPPHSYVYRTCTRPAGLRDSDPARASLLGLLVADRSAQFVDIGLELVELLLD